MTTTYKRILLNTNPTNKVVTIVFNRPKQKNAMDKTMITEIGTALRELSKTSDKDCKAIILTGSGDYYSSGNDLSNFAQVMHPRTMAHAVRVGCEEFVDSFITNTKPIVCAVNGPAIGIPVTTMGLCDKRICLQNATFHTPFKALGQSPEGCSSYTFQRIMGDKMANQMLEGGRKLNAKESLEAKFMDEVIEVDDVLAKDIPARNLKLLARAEVIVLKAKRMTIEKPELVSILQAVNKNEVDVLEQKMVSPECFEALSTYLSSRGKNVPAVMLRAMNSTRFLWDR